MSRCRQCNVEVLDETERCPLCNSVLEQTFEVENMYPDVRIQTRRLTFLSRVYLFGILLLEVILFSINYFDRYKIGWSLIVGLILFYGYLVIRFAILGKTGYRSKIVVLAAIAVLMMIAIDFLVGYHGWSVNYVLPACVIVLDIGIIILMIVNRRNWQSYIMWQILMLLVCVAMLILYLVGIITNPYVMGAAGFVSLFLFLGTLIMGDRRARVELHRRFHIR